MKKVTMRLRIALITGLIALAPMSALAGPVEDFQAGETAYNAGDFSKAFVLWKALADQGIAPAQFNLGNMYANGQGVSKDDAKAALWYQRAAEQGDDMAQLNLGIVHVLGQGVAKDRNAGIEWIRKSALQGNATAMAALDQLDVKPVASLATQSVQKQAKAGDVKAQLKLGDLYNNGQGGLARSGAQAAKWYQMAAEQGNADAQYNLGTLYDVGSAVPQSYPQAAKWYALAVAQDHAGAQLNLGAMYFMGAGVEKDQARGLALIKKSAAQGNTQAAAVLKQISK